MKKRRVTRLVPNRTERPCRILLCLSLAAALCASAFSFESIAFAEALSTETEKNPTVTDDTETPPGTGEEDSGTAYTSGPEDEEPGNAQPDGSEPAPGEAGDGSAAASADAADDESPAPEYEETLEISSDEIETDAVLESYISENLDHGFIAAADQMLVANYLKVMNTMFDGSCIEEGDTIDSILDGIGSADAASYNKFLASIDTKVALYDVCEDSDYFVAYANTMDDIPDAAVFDYAFAVNDYSGTTVEGCFYDEDTGLAYIPKSLFFDDEGRYTVGLIQLQLGQAIGGGLADIDSTVTSSLSGEEDDEVDVYTTVANIFQMETTACAKPGLSASEITVCANGIPLEDDEYSYDPVTGVVTLPVSSSSVGSISVEVDEDTPSVFDRLGDFFSPLIVTAYAAENTGYESWDEIQYSNSTLIELPGWVTAGTALWSDSAYMYYSSSCEEEAASSDWGVGYEFDFDNDRTEWNGDDYVNDWDDSDNQRLIQWIWGDWGSQHLSSDPSYLVVQGEGRYFKFNMSMSTFYYTEEFKKSGDGEWEVLKNEYNTSYCDEAPIGEAVTALQSIGTLYAQCSHVENGDEYYPPSTWQQLPMLVRFVYFSEDSDGTPFAMLACVSSQLGGQTGFGLYKIHALVASTGYLTVQKSAGDGSDIANISGNPNYSLAGAEYTVYTDSACTEIAADADGNNAVLTIGADGSSAAVELWAGTYYVKETKAAPGYDLDTTVYPAEVTTSCTETVPCTVSSTDQPQYGYIELRKSSGNTGVTAGNSEYTLQGATYGIYDDRACSSLAETLTTDENGCAISGKLALGSYYIKEISRPDGYALDGTTVLGPIEVTASSLTDVPLAELSDYPLTAFGITIYKLDAETGGGSQGSASLSGAEFTVRYYAGDYTEEEALSIRPTKTWVIETKEENGQAAARLDDDHKVSGDDWYYDASGNICLPLGTYTILETSAPSGYIIKGTFTDSSGKTVEAGEIYYTRLLDDGSPEGSAEWLCGSNVFTGSDSVISGGVKIQKRDADTTLITPQGDATLAGTSYSITNKSSGSVIVGGKEYAPGEVVMTITADESGLAQTASDALPYGSYTIAESSPPTGYLGSGSGLSHDFTIDSDGEMIDLTGTDGSSYNNVIRGGVGIQKRDLQSGRGSPQGGATFEGAVFEITNESQNAVIVEGVSYKPGDVVKTIVTDETGYACTDADTLPYGTYRITETDAPTGYLLGSNILTAVTEQSFTIREDGVIVDLSALQHSVTDRVKRGDLSFEKQDGDNQSTDLGPVPFRLTSETTGESHVFWTDMNGQYSTSSDWNPHTQNTNAGESYEDGIWFYGYAEGEGSGVEVRDDLGALPYDTYLLEELPCESNAGRSLITTRVTIYRDNTTVHIGTLDNYAYGFSTSAVSTEDGGKYIEAGEEASVTDEIRYWGLDNTKTYTFVTSLFDVTAGELLTDDDGGDLTIETDFKPRSSEGAQDVVFMFDASGLEGHTLVVFESLYDEEGETIEAESDASEEEQTVYLTGTPQIGTTLVDAESGEHGIVAEGELVLTDTVSYEGLVPGKEYVVIGILMDRDTGEPLFDKNGEDITAETVFTAESSEGTVEVTFVFELEIDEGLSTVAFEYLYDAEGNPVTDHTDIDDEDQTVDIETPPEEIPPEEVPPEEDIPPETPEETPEKTVPEETVPEETGNPATGDVSDTAWIVVVAAAACALIAAGAGRRQKSRKRIG